MSERCSGRVRLATCVVRVHVAPQRKGWTPQESGSGADVCNIVSYDNTLFHKFLDFFVMVNKHFSHLNACTANSVVRVHAFPRMFNFLM